MNQRRFGLRLLQLLGVALFAVTACLPDYAFIPDPGETPSHCNNDLRDLDLGETDVDCGGVECRGCELTERCLATTDCREGECLDGFCQVPGCANGSQDGDETDADCGGSCKDCQVSERCLVGTDCVSSVCRDEKCVAPACDDEVLNGDETGRDCGGPVCDGCLPGLPCTEDIDCRDLICDEETQRCGVTCTAGTAECDMNYDVECETNVLVSVEHCGDCEIGCELPHAVAVCAGGECSIDAGGCEAPWDNCNTDALDGCETDLSSDADNCGGCGMGCSDEHGTPSCVDFECQIDCEDDYEDCNDDRADGCEVNLARDAENCASCGAMCEADEGFTAWCRDRMCGQTECEEGFGNCDGSDDDVCEQDILSDVENCGHCGGICSVQNGTPRCEEGVCAVAGCMDGFENCNDEDEDGGFQDGCETNLDEDEENCGGCGIVCSAENGTVQCVEGECRIEGCVIGFANCDVGDGDGGYENGCETNTTSDAANCGGCGALGLGLDCNAVFAPTNATGRCVDSACDIDQCFDNFDDCDESSSNGCESDLRSDEGDCGRCDRQCATDGTTGTPGNECVSGNCVPNCDANHLSCNENGADGCEVDRRSDEAHCGSCDNECEAIGGSNTCTNGACVPGCDSGHLSCDGDASDGCETTCSSAGTASRRCDGGACDVTCDATHLSCDGDETDGCEVTQSASNCGACGRVCMTTNASGANCVSGVCAPSCNDGYAACGDPEDGCTTRLNAIPNCGACEPAGDCDGATPFCVGSGNSFKCQSQITLAGSSITGTGAGSSNQTLSLTFTHAPQAGENRLILVGLATDKGIAANPPTEPNRPIESAKVTGVNYGTTAMTLVASRDGGNEYWGPDLFIYALTESGLAGKPNGTNQTVTVNSNSTTPDPEAIVANIVQFNGVRQNTPLTNANGVTRLDPEPSSVGTSVVVGTMGSRIYSLAAALWAPVPTYTVSPTTTGQTTTLVGSNFNQVSNAQGLQIRASALYVSGGSADALVPNTYTTTWNYSSAGAMTSLAVVINPVQAP